MDGAQNITWEVIFNQLGCSPKWPSCIQKTLLLGFVLTEFYAQFTMSWALGKVTGYRYCQDSSVPTDAHEFR